MASKLDDQQLEDLICPLCLDVFKNPTLLSCGHTFCRECLEAYDEQHHLDHIVCPVCRESTNLGQNRVSGLTPNLLAIGIQDKLHVVATSHSFCPLHKNVHNDIFCEDCKIFICLTCFFDNHKDHKIMKKEEIEWNLKEKRDSLIRESEIRKTRIEESVNNIEQRRTGTRSQFSKVEKEIKDEFAKRVAILQQKEESLLNELDSIREETEKHFAVCIATIRQAIDDINNSATVLRGYTRKNVDSDAIKTQYLQCSKLEKSLKRSIDDASLVRLKQASQSTWFRPSDEKLLALGHIEVGVKETGNIQQVKTSAGAIRKSEQLQTRRKVAVIPPPISSKSLNIVRQIKAPGVVWCMAAAQSQDAVVVGYEISMLKNRPGCDRFSVSGEKTQHLKSEVGNVYDIAFLTDGRSVVSHGRETLHVYSTDGLSTGMQYTCKRGPYCGSIIRLCVDQDDNIYAVNGNPEIYIFHGSNAHPQIVIPTGDIEPDQIYVTKTGALIICDCSSVTMFDREDHEDSSITTSEKGEWLRATVDGQDRVLVARVRSGSDVFRLTRYTLQGTTLIQQVEFNELKLPHAIGRGLFNYMTIVHTKLIAFADYTNLYFIELSE